MSAEAIKILRFIAGSMGVMFLIQALAAISGMPVYEDETPPFDIRARKAAEFALCSVFLLFPLKYVTNKIIGYINSVGLLGVSVYFVFKFLSRNTDSQGNIQEITTFAFFITITAVVVLNSWIYFCKSKHIENV